jgi:hypothetical protein
VSGLHQILVAIIGLVIENNPGASKLKIVETGGDVPFENLLASKLVEIVESEPTFSVSDFCNFFFSFLRKNKCY